MILDLTSVWINTLHHVSTKGEQVSPRGQLTLEAPQYTSIVNMRRPVLTLPERKLSYKFMAAEAYWILSGDNSTEGIVPWNQNIAAFSDDGKTFFGAYGPKIMDQLPYVVDKLLADPMSRQAGLTIWRENPPATKDVPCTVAMFFSIRNRKLNAHVFMRSNDVWLGMPYDVFNFSMVAHLVCARINREQQNAQLLAGEPPISVTVLPGTLYLTAASCHLYRQHWDQAADCFAVKNLKLPVQAATPEGLFLNEWLLLDWLKRLRDAPPESTLRWWNETEPNDESELYAVPTLQEKA
jgi:thymidylate synthase